MRAVIDYYCRDPQAPPAYVLFVSDGGVHQNREITHLMREAAQYPIFSVHGTRGSQLRHPGEARHHERSRGG
ncbi:MAG: VWA domain-containing protein [Thermochromatium sp.]